MCLQTLVVSAHALVRAALLSMLDRESGLVPWEEDAASSGGTPGSQGEIPDLVLVETDRLDHAAIQRIRDLKARYAGAHVLLLTSSDAEESLREALDAGVSGFLLESASRADLMNAIHTVTCGGLYVRHELLRSWLQREPSRLSVPHAESERLTSREVQVLRLLVAGHTNPAIADCLCISVRTVEYHRRNICEKLQTKSRAELVHYALNHGLMADRGDEAIG